MLQQNMTGIPAVAQSASVRTCGSANHRIIYLDRGAGPAVMFVHGMFGDHVDWEPVAERLSRSHRVLALDLPGFGASDKPEIEYSLPVFAQAVAGVLDAAEVSSAVLVGSSLGGQIVSTFARIFSERARAIVLTGAAGMKTYPEEQRELLISRFTEDKLRMLTPEIQELMFSARFLHQCPAFANYLARQNDKLQRDDYPAYAKAMAQCHRIVFSEDTVAQLEALKTPILLLWGDSDPIFAVEHARAALSRLPSARLQTVNASGHLPHLENPERYSRDLLAFLSTLPA